MLPKKDQMSFKNNQVELLEMKNRIIKIKIKNSLMGILNTAEERISKLEVISELQLPKTAGQKETQMGNIMRV